MAVAAMASIRSMIGLRSPPASTSSAGAGEYEPVPTVGFRVSIARGSNKMQVTVIGARHLPAKVSTFPATGYLVKVTLFPSKEKQETEVKPESWPRFDQPFTFKVCEQQPAKCRDLCLVFGSGQFLVFTAYALDSTGKRRAIGAVTWPLDHKVFSKKPDSDFMETADIWKRAQELTSGLSSAKQKREEGKNQMEVSLVCTPGSAEEGETDQLTVSVTRLRWSIQSTRELEQKKALLYVKLAVWQDGAHCLKAHKTQRFEPSISMLWGPENLDSRLTVGLPPVGPQRDSLSCSISVCTKPTVIGKKIVLGHVTLGPQAEDNSTGCEHWEQALQSGGNVVNMWHKLESRRSVKPEV